MLWVPYLKLFLSKPQSQILSPSFSLRSFSVVGLIFKSVIHFKSVSDDGEVVVKVQIFCI